MCNWWMSTVVFRLRIQFENPWTSPKCLSTVMRRNVDGWFSDCQLISLDFSSSTQRRFAEWTPALLCIYLYIFSDKMIDNHDPKMLWLSMGRLCLKYGKLVPPQVRNYALRHSSQFRCLRDLTADSVMLSGRGPVQRAMHFDLHSTTITAAILRTIYRCQADVGRCMCRVWDVNIAFSFAGFL